MNLMKALMAVVLGTLFSSYALAASDAATSQETSIKERIAPVGEVCLTGEKCGNAAPAAAAGGGEPRSGKEIFTNVCSGCHGSGVMGAPKFGNKGDWAPRIAKGMDTLYSHAINGFNSMPPKGTCSDCSEKEIHNAVDYMTSNSK